MATTESAALRLHAATVSTTAETWSLTTPVKQVKVYNRDTDPVFVTLATAENAAAAEAAIVTAVADADETFLVPAGGSAIIWKSKRAQYVAGSIIGNASTYDVEGSVWYE